MKKVTYIISNINKALAFEWIATFLSNRYELSFILLNPGDSELETFLKQKQIPVERITYSGKKDIPKAFLKTYRYLKRNRPHCIHAHLFDASLIGLTAGKLAGVKKRIYTRHHSDYHHTHHPHAVKYDKFTNSMATDIIAISAVVKDILIEQEQVPKQKIHLIHHGFLLQDFIAPAATAINRIKQRYNPQQQKPVIGVISRYSEWKGLQYSIPAFEQLIKDYPNALLVLANARGDFKHEIQKILEKIPKKNYIEIDFESDIFALYQLFDVFIHVPKNKTIEAFGQIYIEALAAGIPSVFTVSGIANDFITDRENALVVPYKDSAAIYKAVKEVLEDKQLAQKLVSNGKKDVLEKFDLTRMITDLDKLYGG